MAGGSIIILFALLGIAAILGLMRARIGTFPPSPFEDWNEDQRMVEVLGNGAADRREAIRGEGVPASNRQPDMRTRRAMSLTHDGGVL